MKFSLLLATICVSSLSYASELNLMDKVTSLSCKAYYGGEDLDYLTLVFGPKNPGAPQELGLIHQFVPGVVTKRLGYFVTDLTYNAEFSFYTVKVISKSGVNGVLAFRNGIPKSGSFKSPDSSEPYDNFTCSIKGNW